MTFKKKVPQKGNTPVQVPQNWSQIHHYGKPCLCLVIKASLSDQTAPVSVKASPGPWASITTATLPWQRPLTSTPAFDLCLWGLHTEEELTLLINKPGTRNHGSTGGIRPDPAGRGVCALSLSVSPSVRANPFHLLYTPLIFPVRFYFQNAPGRLVVPASFLSFLSL